MRYILLIVISLTNYVAGQSFDSAAGIFNSLFSQGLANGNNAFAGVSNPGFSQSFAIGGNNPFAGVSVPGFSSVIGTSQIPDTVAETLAATDPSNLFRGLGFPFNFLNAFIPRGVYRNALERSYPNGLPRNLEKGCNLRVVNWARVESNLPTIHLDISKPFRIGKCTSKFKDMQYARLVTNTGQKFLNMAEDHKIQFNAFYCINDSGRRGVKVESASNPTCSDILNGNDPGCEYKKVKWARIESNLGSIKLQINKDHVIGGCSTQFPAMQWARLVTNVGSKNLDLNVDNQIKFNNKLCGGEGFGAEILIHRDCNPALYTGYQKTNVNSF